MTLYTHIKNSMQLSRNYLQAGAYGLAAEACNDAYVLTKELNRPELKLRCQQLFIRIFQQSGEKIRESQFKQKVNESIAILFESGPESNHLNSELSSLKPYPLNELIHIFEDSTFSSEPQSCSDTSSSDYSSSDESSTTPMTASDARRRLRQLWEESSEEELLGMDDFGSQPAMS